VQDVVEAEDEENEAEQEADDEYSDLHRVSPVEL
jgi:hypothetical protein